MGRKLSAIFVFGLNGDYLTTYFSRGRADNSQSKSPAEFPQ
jgi:hypothetical protein